MKICSKKGCKFAGQLQPLTNFSKDRYTRDGYRSRCKACAIQDWVKWKPQRLARVRQTQTAVATSTPAPAPAPVPVPGAPGVAPVVASEATAPAPVPPPVPPAVPLDDINFDIDIDHAGIATQERQHERAKRDLKAEHTGLLEENERLQRELDAIRDAMRPPEIIVYDQPQWERMDALALVLGSDWHCEEKVVGEAVHKLNEYNLDIAKERSRLFFTHLLRLTDIFAKESRVTTIFMAWLGDLFTGWIHEELMAATILAPADACRFVKGLIVSGIEFLLRESSYILDGVMIPGNHGRMTKTMSFTNPTGTSLETVMYESVVDHFRDNPRVRFEVSEHAMRYRTFFENFVVRFIHGYEVKYNGGIGGITIPLNKAIAQWDVGVRASLTCLGHYHQFFDGGNFLVNGSMIGFNAYAQAIKAKFEKPQQAFALIHAHGGGTKSAVAPIWLDEKK